MTLDTEPLAGPGSDVAGSAMPGSGAPGSDVAGFDARRGTAGLLPLLRPASVVVVGAGRRPGTVGHAVLANLLASGYQGRLYAVNRHAEQVRGLPTHPSVCDLPEPPDLAVVCVPAAAVPAVAEECGRRGVPALAVLAAGITGVPEIEDALRAAVARYRMRLVGPNSLGVANADGDVTFHATVAADRPAPGPVGVVAQSDAAGIAVLGQLARLGIGTSTVVSLGDRYDVSGNDLLGWWEGDPATRIGVLCADSVGDPRRFARAARRLAAVKPLVVLASGGAAAARRATTVAHEPLYRQAGVIAVDTLTDLTATVAVLARTPEPAGRRVAVVSNAAGAGVVAADACLAAGLELPPLSAATRDRLRALLPAAAGVVEPVHTTAGVTPAAFAAALRAVLADPTVDALIAIAAPTALGDLLPTGTPPTATPPTGTARRADDPGGDGGAAGGGRKVTLLVRVGQAAGVELVTTPDGLVLPCFADPAVAAGAYARVAHRADRLRAPRTGLPTGPRALPGLDLAAVRSLVDTALRAQPDGCWLPPGPARALLSACRIPVLEPRRAAPARRGGLVALRSVGTVPPTDPDRQRNGTPPPRPGRRDGPFPPGPARGEGPLPPGPARGESPLPPGPARGDEAPLLGPSRPDAAPPGYRRLVTAVDGARADGTRRLMAAGRVELAAGIELDATFGPLVVLGTGGGTGAPAERVWRLAPLADRDAREMVAALGCAPLLAGYRGNPPADVDALVEVLLRLGRLADARPEIQALDLDPLLVRPDGCVAMDVRIRVARRRLPDLYPRRDPATRAEGH
jgi:acyl-CoA synthetase (NDP forming)